MWSYCVFPQLMPCSNSCINLLLVPICLEQEQLQGHPLGRCRSFPWCWSKVGAYAEMRVRFWEESRGSLRTRGVHWRVMASDCVLQLVLFLWQSKHRVSWVHFQFFFSRTRCTQGIALLNFPSSANLVSDWCNIAALFTSLAIKAIFHSGQPDSFQSISVYIPWSNPKRNSFSAFFFFWLHLTCALQHSEILVTKASESKNLITFCVTMCGMDNIFLI